ncbi:hypothetical protein PPACK8108_LOCUS21217 [Phakopsora pachyrhizi]|uniref:Uncharacterized protein n=1 Tax=Phakopsora pachyrhizi TaxID=170000 RepID=A0AAV0BGW5_PHAPC|nr:hypothetical protein PPACK8108_LOCUS21217 [Phakopsora pachyrhizi]
MLSGAKNQEIDITAIENQNEKIQPIKSGRSALKLSSLFLSKISQSCYSSSITDSSKNSNIRIKDDDNDDDYETKLENVLRVETFNPISLLDRHRKVHLESQRKIIILELIENDQSIKSKAGPIITKETKDQSLIGKLRKNPLEVGNVCLELKDFRRFREVLKLILSDFIKGEANKNVRINRSVKRGQERLKTKQQLNGSVEGEGRGVTDDGFEGWEGVDGHQRSTVGLQVQSLELIKLLTCLDITTPDNEYDRGPTNRDKKVALNGGQTQWVVVTRGDLLAEVYPEVSKWKLDYDLRGWEPDSESKISEHTEDGDLIRGVFVNMTCPVGKLVGPIVWPYYG